MTGRSGEMPRRRSFTKWFVVSSVRQDFAVDGEAVSQGTAGMIDYPGYDGDIIGKFHPAPLTNLDKLDLGSHGVHRNRKVWTPHLTCDDLFKGQSSVLRTKDGEFRASDIGRGKKG